MKADAIGLPLTLDVDDAQILIIGDSEEADRKQSLCEGAGARVTRSPGFDPAQLDRCKLVMLCVRDATLAAQVHAEARARAIPCWSCDDPAHSDFAMPAIARLGPAQAAFSTSGRSPALAAQLRRAFESELGEHFARFVDALGRERERCKREIPDADDRRAAMQALLDGFTLELSARYPDWFEP